MKVICCLEGKPNIAGFSAHSHDVAEIKLQVKGTVDNLVGDKRYRLEENDVVVIPANTVHAGTAIDGTFSDWYFLVDAPAVNEVCVVRDIDGSIRTLMELMIRVMALKEAGYEQIASHLADAVFTFIRRHRSAVPCDPAVTALKNTLYAHIADVSFDLAGLSRQSGYCPDYLRRLFKHETGTTPHAYLTDLRLERAKALLAQDNYAGVSDVAARCGFADSFYFSTCFRKHVGLSPLQFRKKLSESGAKG